MGAESVCSSGVRVCVMNISFTLKTVDKNSTQVAPAKMHSDAVAAPTSFFLRRRQAPQQWEVVTAADHSSRSKHLRACLGFSETAAPWYVL